MLALKNLLKAADRLRKRYVPSVHARELHSYEERLRQESLYLSCTAYDQLVIL